MPVRDFSLFFWLLNKFFGLPVIQPRYRVSNGVICICFVLSSFVVLVFFGNNHPIRAFLSFFRKTFKMRLADIAALFFVLCIKMQQQAEWLQLNLSFSVKSDIYIRERPVFIGQCRFIF